MSKYINRITYIVLLISLIFSGYKIVSYYYNNHRSEAAYDELKSMYRPAPVPATVTPPSSGELLPNIKETLNKPDNTGYIQQLKEYWTEIEAERMMMQQKKEEELRLRQETFTNLQKKNKDIIAWIYIPNTVIDYPVVKGTDNEFYLTHDALKKHSEAGAIFMDFQNKLDKDIKNRDNNLIIYGHHMKNGTMFKDLTKFRETSFFENNRFIYLDTKSTKETWEIFSVYTAKADFNYRQINFYSTTEYTNFLKSIKAKSMHYTDVKLSSKDKIITLSTCSYAFENARLVVHARLVKSE